MRSSTNKKYVNNENISEWMNCNADDLGYKL